MKFTNAVEPAANARVWGKGVPGKCFGGTNFEIPEWMYTRELVNSRRESLVIKTPDLCERCVHSVEHCSGFKLCEGCPMCLYKAGTCLCLTIERNTPCPYFEEACDE